MSTLDLPPPFCNSSLHIGHLYEYGLVYPFYKINDVNHRSTLFKRSKVLLDKFKAPTKKLSMTIGVDVNGLPITRAALKLDSDLPLTQRCDAIIKQNSKNFRDIFELMGLFTLGDYTWYTTQSPKVKNLAEQFLSELDKKGCLHVKFLPYRFCPKCNSFLSNSETDLVEEYGYYYYLKANCLGRQYTIMSTRPQGIIGAVAVVINPDDSRYTHLKGQKFTINVLGNELVLPVYESSYVYPKVGTGILMMAQWGSLIDIQMSRALNLTQISTIYDDRGDLLPHIKELYKIDKPIDLLSKPGISQVITKGQRVLTKTLRHTQRSDCREEVKFLQAEQIVITPNANLLQEFKSFLDSVQITDESTKHQLVNNVKTLRDWCISRSTNYYSTSHNFKGVNFNLDTWVLSSLSYLINEDPQVIRLQGTDIIRTWLLYSLFTNFIMKDLYPNRLNQIYTHKMVCDQKNQKISKSKNNSPDLLECLKDIPSLRLYFCQKPLTNNFSFKVKEYQDAKKFLNKIKNTGIKLDTLNEQFSSTWSELIDELLKPNPKFKSPALGRFLIHYKKFFEKDCYQFKFSGFIALVRSMVYNVSSWLNDPTSKPKFLIGLNLETPQAVYVVRKIWELITEFINCFY